MQIKGAELQPRYERHLDCHPQRLLDALRARSDSGDVRIEFRGQHAQVSMAPHDVRWWSPWLTFQIIPTETDTTAIDGRFGSNPAFFTLWMAGLAFFLLSTLGFGIYGYSQFVAGISPTGLWGAGATVLVASALAALPLLGQHRAQQQMQKINNALETCFSAALRQAPDSLHDDEQPT